MIFGAEVLWMMENQNFNGSWQFSQKWPGSVGSKVIGRVKIYLSLNMDLEAFLNVLFFVCTRNGKLKQLLMVLHYSEGFALCWEEWPRYGGSKVIDEVITDLYPYSPVNLRNVMLFHVNKGCSFFFHLTDVWRIDKKKVPWNSVIFSMKFEFTKHIMFKKSLNLGFC